MMIRDYSPRYSGPVGTRQNVSSRKFRVSAGRGLFWKGVGFVAAGGVIVAMLGSLWFGLMVRDGLRDLGSRQVYLVQARNENSGLEQGKNELMARERIEVRASLQSGLYSPSAGQVIGPRF